MRGNILIKYVAIFLGCVTFCYAGPKEDVVKAATEVANILESGDVSKLYNEHFSADFKKELSALVKEFSTTFEPTTFKEIFKASNEISDLFITKNDIISEYLVEMMPDNDFLKKNKNAPKFMGEILAAISTDASYENMKKGDVASLINSINENAKKHSLALINKEGRKFIRAEFVKFDKPNEAEVRMVFKDFNGIERYDDEDFVNIAGKWYLEDFCDIEDVKDMRKDLASFKKDIDPSTNQMIGVYINQFLPMIKVLKSANTKEELSQQINSIMMMFAMMGMMK